MYRTNNNGIIKNIHKVNDFVFSNNTTYGLGGSAKFAYYPKTEREACAVFDYLSHSGENFMILGAGSNILAADSGFNGAVICTKYLKGIQKYSDKIYCSSGTTVSELLKYCKNNSLGGLEYLAGIPATIGGLTLMNGGIAQNHIEENVVSVRLFDGNIKEIKNKSCNFGIKHSTMRDIKCVVLGVFLSVFAVTRETVEKNIKYYLDLRRNQPKGKSCGCVFKNPERLSAGRLIDDAGLKGYSIGGAVVSDRHANFIMNKNASSADVYKLIQLVKEKVYIKYGVKLEEEVVYIGEFNDFDS